jgi:hypothetical protein
VNYLYGDSTPSPLKSNFLEFLRDSLDFCVFALLADDRIRLGREHVELMRRRAEEQGAHLDAFVTSVAHAIDEAPKGEQGGPTARCAAQLAGHCGEALRIFQDEIRKQLAADVAEAEAKENAERSACKHALETLLIPHAPPDAVDVVTLTLGAHEANMASSAGQAPFGLAWAFDLAIPPNNLWSSMVRIDRVVPALEIRAPQLSGWLSKEVKVKPQRIERHVVTEYVDDGETVSLKLRAEASARAGFDVQINPAGKRVESIERVAEEGKEGASVGAFDLEPDDVGKLVDLAEKLRAATRDFERRRLASATVDGAAFETIPNFTALVTRLIATMTPIVREISDRSLTGTELVLRQLLGNDRREEIFVTKASLREKYGQLPGGLRAHFAPLGLAPAPAKSKAEASKETTQIAVVRSELAPSKPPSQPPSPPSKAPSKSPSGSPTANAALEPAIPRAAPLPTPAPIAPADLEVRPSTPPNAAPPQTVEAMVAELKRIVGLLKKQSVDEAYRAFESLYAADKFATFRVEDQRQALKIMVLRQAPSPAPESVVDAYLHAITHLQRLVETSGDAGDFEMLGLAHLVIDDTETASKMFQQGLAIEREKNPSSELCGRLMKHVSSI